MILRVKHNYIHRKQQQQMAVGFSLIELLVVLAILALLAGVVAPQVMKHMAKARSDTARLQIEDLGAALDLYYLEVADYPMTEQGLQALISAPADVANWNGPYLKKKKIPNDPWQRPYQYVSPGEHGAYDLFSLGKDNQQGGEGENKDVLSWE